jgi:hypothetical protein
MDAETIQVQARWRHTGVFEPTQFFWKGVMHRIASTGRHWEDADGYHVLCMAGGGEVYELIFQLNPAGWRIRPISSSHRTA